MSADLPLPDMPDLELDESALRTPSTRPAATFQVRLGPVRDPVETAPSLVEILRIDLPTAQRIAMNAPGVLLAGVSRQTAEETAARVRALGLRATVEDESTPEWAPSVRPSERAPSVRPLSERPLSSHPPSMAPASVRPSPIEASGDGPGDGFWMQTPIAFVAPFLGRGWLLLIASGMVGVGVGLMAAVPGLLLKLGALMGLQLVAFGLFVEIFNRLAQAATFRDDDAWLPEPLSELPHASTLFWRGVVNVLVFALLAAPAVIIALYTQSALVVLALEVVLFLYWPMALTVQSISGRLAGPLDVVTVARGIVTAPLEYLAVCALTFAAIVGSTFAVVAASGVGAVAVGASGAGLGGGVMLYAFMAFAWYASIGYFHGVLGYLMGSLVRSKGEAFEFLHEG